MKLTLKHKMKKIIKKVSSLVYKKILKDHIADEKVRYSGYEIGETRKTLDKYIPGVKHKSDRETYESGILKCINRRVNEGDIVVIVGGGYGVTATASAKKIGRDGKVYIYEGSTEFVEKTQNTLEVNNVLKRAVIRHAIVGKEVELRGERGNPNQVSPESLSECDILELDCEGSEVEILKNMNMNPKTIIVETHGHKKSNLKKVSNVLKEKGYKIEQKEYADDSKKEFCEENEIFVLEAVSTSAKS